MKREYGIAVCGLACCLCSKNGECSGCHSGGCEGSEWCEVKKCVLSKEISHCYKCDDSEKCSKGIMQGLKPKAFTLFAQKYGEESLMKCLERNENNGIIYHRNGINGDYDGFDKSDDLIEYIRTGERRK